jgi:hypothetical protein
MSTDYCNHPMGVLLTEQPLTDAQYDSLVVMKRRAAEMGKPISDLILHVADVSAEYRVIECSWCRNPAETVQLSVFEMDDVEKFSAPVGE